MDADGYPEQFELNVIAQWAAKYYRMMDFIKARWHYANDGYWRQNGRLFFLSTGGWSGNEEIISAMQKNWIFWMFCWRVSRYGGHYVFRLPEEK